MTRICCPACRNLTMNVHSGIDKTGPVVLSMDKNFHCPMIPAPLACFMIISSCGVNACFVCPMMLAALVAEPKFAVRQGTQMLGEIHDPAGPLCLCNMDAKIKNASGQEVMHTGPSTLCQIGMMCPCCAEATVPVTKDGKPVAHITRNAVTLCELCQKTNRFTIDFGSIQDPVQRKQIFASAMLLDLQYWEQK
eukprot:TRINITY_DN20233_c0_g1_i6.p1 TRINITY_DN20233_c0_g1~~TRINITY_DN20233_c0_g1_i6.p1  ORF type:complete len:193 (-),score=31.50 TRINITY_DN20233_c0_g1_i6:527-1105(-)